MACVRACVCACVHDNACVCVFPRWSPVPGNPYAAPGSVEGDRSAVAVAAMRTHKGIVGPIPTAVDLGDKL